MIVYDIPSLNFLQIREIAKEIYKYNKTLNPEETPILKKRNELVEYIYRNQDIYKSIFGNELIFTEVVVDCYSLQQVREMIKDIWNRFPAVKEKLDLKFPRFNLNNKTPVLIKYFNKALDILENKRFCYSDTEDEYNYKQEDFDDFFDLFDDNYDYE